MAVSREWRRRILISRDIRLEPCLLWEETHNFVHDLEINILVGLIDFYGNSILIYFYENKV